ncbi:hypothetical protein JTE90_012218 [Oedothorax gibbosus]|uniref:Uncharacterized protein n=1 Tax=Oedothorax gibbosus TaxID=931172 RepID=A0AAV6TID4_9ARAC|nr:hypothetical protein JTE90_012218 [Oedothorax gibbosus]
MSRSSSREEFSKNYIMGIWGRQDEGDCKIIVVWTSMTGTSRTLPRIASTALKSRQILTKPRFTIGSIRASHGREFTSILLDRCSGTGSWSS